MVIKTTTVLEPKERRLEVARQALSGGGSKRPVSVSGSASSPKGVRVTLVVPLDVLEAYKAGGRFYQTRMVEALRRGLE